MKQWMLALVTLAFMTHAEAEIKAKWDTGFLNREWKEVAGYTQFGSVASVYWQGDIGFQSYWEFGGIFHQDFGDGVLENSGIHARMVWMPTPQSDLTLGTLHTEHDIHPALWTSDEILEDITQQGIQYRWQGDRLNADVWIDWQQIETEREAETYDFGFAIAWKIRESLTLHSQFFSVHTGGQNTFDISELRDNALALGLTTQLPFFTNSPSHSLWFDYFLMQTEYSENEDFSLDGRGQEGKLYYRFDTPKNTNVNLFYSRFIGSDIQTSRGLRPYQTEDYQQLGFTGQWEVDTGLTLKSMLVFENIEGDFASSQGLSLVWVLD